MSEDWEKAKKIFADAIKLAPELRLQYLDDVCAYDTDTRREVESLLASFDDAESFMEKPAVGEVADVMHQAKNLERGKCFGHYEIIEQIGTGGMGEVYLAQDKKLDRKVGVKILNEKFRSHESNLNRFISEAKAASALNHPNILVIHEFGESDEAHYIVSEFIKGKTLREILKEKSWQLLEVLDIAIQIASALSAAHEAHLVHRDIKPENVMIREDGIVKVLDFGLAKLVEQTPTDAEAATRMQTQAGMIMGTVNYMSPEQARGKKVDARTDIFSFGCVLYEMLTRRQAFIGETINHTIVAILEKEPSPLSLFVKDFPAEIEGIVKKCLEKNLEERYESAKDLLADLKALVKRLEFEAELERSSAPDKKTQAETQIFKAAITEETPILPQNNLTGNQEPIIGREKEIAEIKDFLRQTNVRLVTLTGVGGVGKTRLAQAVAEDLLSDFSDGVFFVELAAVTGAELVASAIAQPLGVKEAGGKPILEILKDYLGDKKMLLVIDNFEQVTAAAPQIRELLNAPRLKILITSRTLLRLSVESEFVVPPLAAPSKTEEISLEKTANYEAVKLFVQRAQKAKPGFVLTEENAGSVAEICARLEGLPLAIELAAARVKILAPQTILTKLENRLKLLTGGASDLPARQQTMRGAVKWSYELLGEDEQQLFRRLSVFAGGFTFETAEAVCGGYERDKEQIDFLDLLTSLVDKNLLVTKDQSDGAETRFGMLEVVREYALESLEASDEAENMCRRHAEYFLALGEEAEPQLQATQGVEWFNRLEAEHDNLRAALEWSLERCAVKAAHLAGALRNFWATHCHFTEGRKWLEGALERGGLEIPVTVRFKLLNGLGSLTRMQGDYAGARKAYEQGLVEGKAANDLRQIAHSNRGLGLVSFQQGDLTTARKFMEVGLASLRKLGDNLGLALTLTSLGDLERAEGNNAAARLLFEESLAICRQMNNKVAMISTLSNLGAINFQESNFAVSHSYFAEALATARELEEKIIISISLDGFAALASKRSEQTLAARLAGAAQHLREKIGYEMELIDRRFRDAYLTELKAKMDEADFSKFYEQGRKMKLEELVELIQVLKDLPENPKFDETLDYSPPHGEKSTKSLTTASDLNLKTSEINYSFAESIKQHKALAAFAVAILLIGAIGFGYYFWSARKISSDGKKSLAVLPFVNASQDANAEYLSDGITESIINNLSQLAGLKVMSRNSAFRFKNNQTDIKNIALQLGVETLVTGDIRQLGDKLVINVRLIDASDDSQIWGNQYVKNSADVIAAQTEIAQAVAQNLRLKLSNTEQQQMAKRPTENAEAYQLYQRGRFHVFKLTPPEINKGISYFQQAINLDPNYALAYAGLADAYRSLAISSELSPTEFLPKAQMAANRAIEIDDALPEAHTALGATLFWQWNWNESENQFKRALELNPNEANVHIFYAHLLSNTGRHTEALAEIKRARELDPLFPFAGALEGQFLLHAGQPDDALDRLRKTFELAPNFWMPHLFAASVYTEKGMFEEAVAEARKARELSPAQTISIAYESYALAKSGKNDEARILLNELLKLSETRFVPPVHFALIYNGLGETDKTFEWLEKGYRQRDPKMAFLKVEPKWNNLRSEPRFIELMRRMNFE